MVNDQEQIRQIAEILVSKVPEIDLVLLYGSFARGNNHELSDYDLIVVCDAKKVVWEFILNNRVVKAWSTTWQNLEANVNGEAGCWSVAAASYVHGKIIWVKNEEVTKKLETIISKVHLGGRKVLEETVNFEEPYSKLWLIKRNIEQGKLENIRMLIWSVAIGIAHRLAALNNSYYKNNWGKQLAEMEQFEIKPINFKERYVRMTTREPQEALKEAEQLVEDLQQLYRETIIKQNPSLVNGIDALRMEWSSVIETFNAIKSAAKANDLIDLLYETTDFIETIMWMYFSLQNQTWERNDYYPIDEYIKKLPKEIQKDVEIVMQSKDGEVIVKSAETIVENLKQQFLVKQVQLPLAKSLQEGLEFLQIM